MTGTKNQGESQESPFNHDDPKNAAELDRLDAKLARLHREAAMLAAAMRPKPKKP